MRALAALLAVLLFRPSALSACDTAEERAEAHYQRAMALLAAGDDDRAMVEFRNVFRLNGEHVAARLAYAARAAPSRARSARPTASTCAWSSRTRRTSRATGR